MSSMNRHKQNTKSNEWKHTVVEKKPFDHNDMDGDRYGQCVSSHC